MISKVAAMTLVTLAIAGCAEQTKHQGSATATTGTAAQKTLEAATTAAQEMSDRHTSGDYAGEWLMYSHEVRQAVSENDFVTYNRRCRQERIDKPTGINLDGMPIKVVGVHMDGDSKAVVRQEFMMLKVARTMVYEDNGWFLEPGSDLRENLGKPVSEWKC